MKEVTEEDKPKANPRANAKATDNEEVEQEEVKQEEIKQEDVKPKDRNRPEWKEKASCSDCGKEVTLHGLKYTHKRHRKANQPELQPTSMPKLERTATTETIASLVPADEQIAAFILNQREMKANEKRETMSSVVSRALPK